MGYSPWGHKESDRTERLHSLTSLNHILLLFLSFSVLGIIRLLLSREARHSVLLYHILSQPPNTYLHGIVFNIIFVLCLFIRGIFFFPPCTYKLLVYSNSSGDLAEFIFPVGALLLLWVLWLFFLPVAQFLPKF